MLEANCVWLAAFGRAQICTCSFKSSNKSTCFCEYWTEYVYTVLAKHKSTTNIENLPVHHSSCSYLCIQSPLLQKPASTSTWWELSHIDRPPNHRLCINKDSSLNRGWYLRSGTERRTEQPILYRHIDVKGIIYSYRMDRFYKSRTSPNMILQLKLKLELILVLETVYNKGPVIIKGP